MLDSVTTPRPLVTALISVIGALFWAGCSGDGVEVTPDGGIDGGNPPAIVAPKLTSRRLVTRGNALIDELGRKVILRGVNIGGRSKMPPFVPFELDDGADVRAKAEPFMNAVQKLGAWRRSIPRCCAGGRRSRRASRPSTRA